MVRAIGLTFPALLIGVFFGCCLVYLLQGVNVFSQPQAYFRLNSGLYSERDEPDSEASELGFNETFNINNITTGVQTVSQATVNLYDKVRILCWVLTTPDNHKTRAMAVKETWGKRCNILLFMSSAEDESLPSIKLPVNEGRNQLWGKTREAYRYIWNNYRDKADWFFKADDDTYAIMENMRYFLSAYNTSHPLWFGHKFKTIVKQGYFSGGAGYVLSKEATRRFVEEGYFNALICRHDHEGAEDAEMGKCMKGLNVSAMDTRDANGRGRFFPFIPEQHIRPGKIVKDYWYWQAIYYPPKEGLKCCSDTAITFHYVKPEQMYLFEYFIYQLKPYGFESENRPITPEPPPDLALNATPWIATDNSTFEE